MIAESLYYLIYLNVYNPGCTSSIFSSLSNDDFALQLEYYQLILLLLQFTSWLSKFDSYRHNFYLTMFKTTDLIVEEGKLQAIIVSVATKHTIP